MGITDEYHRSVTPLVVFFILCNIIGFFGNLSGLFIYSLRYPKNRHRLLVIVLSIIDMTACCTTVPIETVSTWFWFDAPSSSLCKARFFFIMFLGLSAMYMLFVTAVYKYLRICKRKRITQKMIIILCGIGVVISFIYGIPPLVLFDVNKHFVTIKNRTEVAWICEVHTSFHGTQYPAVYRHCVAVYSLLLVTAVILYIFVAKTTVQHVQRMKTKPKISGTASASESAVSSIDQTMSTTSQTVSKTTDGGGGNKVLKVYVAGETFSGPVPSDDTTRPSNDYAACSQESTPARPKSHLSAYQIRTVLIMVIVAGTFAVTFMMGLAFGYVFALRKYEDYSSIGELVFLFACYRLYFLNYCMNHVVYFALDRQFRREVFKVFDSVKTVVM